ncbi:MAG: DNA polymerase III subunit alpha [Bacteriovoracaceae bacterium]|nr:DNA polymerase III subunit alpha [Bacteriovoracaceae bacterium]
MSEEIHVPLTESHKDSFVHLHVHSEYSLLDGAIKLPELFDKCKETNMPAVALTDHGNMFGAIDFYKKALKAGVKPIFGCEIYYTAGSRHDKGGGLSENKNYHLVLLCKNLVGYHNLCKLVTKAYMEGFYYRPRADYDLLREFGEGLICSSACLGGEANNLWMNGEDTKAATAALKMKDIFGEDFYLEIQENGMEEQNRVNRKAVAFARANDIKLLATNDCHYLNKDDSTAHEVLMCIQTGKTLDDENRFKMETDTLYVRTPKEMRELFHYAPDACDNTLKIAEQCNVELKWTDDEGNPIYLLPTFAIDTGEGQDEYFKRIVSEGLDARFEGPHFRKLILEENWETEKKQIYLDRMKIEVDMIIEMGFPGYFLIVADFIKWSKDNGIPVGPGRGSGAGSIVAYAMNITNIDPLPYNLLFERFINPERISMPDFDVDFCQAGRGRVIDYVTEKYGHDKVSQIITFGKLLAKGVIRDVSRVYGLPYAEADAMAKLIPDELGIKLKDAIEKEPELKNLIDSDPKIRQVFSIALKLETLNRNAGIHAAGIVITDKPLEEYCPLSRGNGGELVCQFDKNYSEEIGLVKFDFLGLKTLTVINHAEKFIRRDKIADFDIEEINTEDSAVYQFIGRGETIGVFQLESDGMINLCKRIKPNSLDDVTAINALYRPGPLGSGMVDDFIEIKHGRQELVFPYEELRDILKDTYGIIVYQEQVMNIARIVAGYSLGQADMLRRAMGKKKISEMEHHKRIFLDGAKERNYDLVIAEDLYDKMAKFAEYGFNKSHAVAYAYIAYQTAFLKFYYTAEFYAGLLSTELSNMEKVTRYISDATNYDVELLPPDVNHSLWLFNVVDGNISFGMGAIKGVGEGPVDALVTEREENGEYNGLLDFCERVHYRSVNKRILDALIRSGAFDNCENSMNRKTMLESVELISAYCQRKQQEAELGQIDLFSASDSAEDKTPKELLDQLGVQYVSNFPEKELLQMEKELMGIFVSGHPLDSYQDLLEKLASMSIASVEELNTPPPKAPDPSQSWKRDDGSQRDLTLAGLVTESRMIMTKKGDKMAFARLEDFSGDIEVIVFPTIYAEYGELLEGDEPIIIDGYTKLSEDPRKFYPKKISLLKDQTDERITDVRVLVDLNITDSRGINKLKQSILSYKGTVPVHFIIKDNEGNKLRMHASREFLVNPTPQFAARVNELMQCNSVGFIVDGKLEDASLFYEL